MVGTVELDRVVPDSIEIESDLVLVGVLPLVGSSLGLGSGSLELVLERGEIHRVLHDLEVVRDSERDGIDGREEGEGFAHLLERTNG